MTTHALEPTGAAADGGGAGGGAGGPGGPGGRGLGVDGLGGLCVDVVADTAVTVNAPSPTPLKLACTAAGESGAAASVVAAGEGTPADHTLSSNAGCCSSRRPGGGAAISRLMADGEKPVKEAAAFSTPARATWHSMICVAPLGCLTTTR